MYTSNTLYSFPFSIVSNTGGLVPSSLSGSLYLNTILNSTPITITSSSVSGVYFATVTLPQVSQSTTFSIRVNAVISGTSYDFVPVVELLNIGGLPPTYNKLDYRPLTDPF